jgi:hypothetical protein
MDLTKAGITVWLDEWEIKVGESIIQKIQQGLRESDFVAIWLTRQSVASGWVEREWHSRFLEEIETRRVLILPLRGEACEIPQLLRDKKYADFIEDYDTGLTDLLKVLGATRHISQADLEHHIATHFDVSKFKKEPQWGDEYSWITFRCSFDESTWIFWNEKTRALEKWRADSVRWYGPERLMLDDIDDVEAFLRKLSDGDRSQITNNTG